MVAVLPGAMATGRGALGIRATSGPFESLARGLAPVAQPLMIVGLLLLVVAALRCSWAATAIVLVGGVLLYVSKYRLPWMGSSGGGRHSGIGDMTGMMGSHAPARSLSNIAGAAGVTSAPLFYDGLGLIVGAFVFSYIRRRREACRPVLAF